MIIRYFLKRLTNTQWRNCGVIADYSTKIPKSKKPLNRSDREDLRMAGIAGFEPTSDGVKVR